MTDLKIEKDSWNFSPLVEKNWKESFDEDTEKIREKVKGFANKWSNVDFTKDENSLKSALDEFEGLKRDTGLSGKLGFFIWLKKQQNQLDENIKAKYNIIDELERQNSSLLNFFTIKISKVPKEIQAELLSSKELSVYKNYLKRLFRKGKYTLSENEEKIITMMEKTSYQNWIDLVNENLSKEERDIKGEKKNFSEILAMMSDKDKSIRDSAADSFNEILEKHSDVATFELNSILQYKKTNDELRGYTRPDESRLVSDDIDANFVDPLILAVTKNYDIAKEFYELKAKLLGLKKLKYHERNIVYGHIDKTISFKEASEKIFGLFNDLDKDIGKHIKHLIEEGSLDVYPTKGKLEGAFCTEGLKGHPTYILLNFTDKFDDLRIMAHELGHGVNSEMMKIQNSLNFTISMSLAEVASKFFEEIVYEDSLKNAKDDEEKLAFLMNELNDKVSSVIRQIACYNLEMDLHQGFRKKGYLSKEEIGHIFRKNMSAYMGDFVEQTKGSEYWWIYWSHIRQFFYVYSYSSGALIASAMKSRLENDPKFILKIKDFFSLGSSKSPMEAFKDIGLDINESFWDQGLDEIRKKLNEAKMLAKKLEKI